ncbi:hypothetical protein ACKWTF_007319 [Chironomus riparius]
MGRKKIQISRITDERNRQVTFNKRKFGVMKKAYELSVLCDCEIALIIFSSSNKLYQYASTDMDKVLLKYTEYNEPHESLTNKNIIEKENKNGTMSPDSPEPEESYTLTPRTEAKYNKIDEDFQMMMQRNQLSSNRTMGSAANSYSLPVSVPVSYNDGNLLQASPQMAHQNISPRPSSSETDSAFPNTMLEMSNGYPSSPLGPSPSPSPGLIGHHNNKSHHLIHSKQHSPSNRSTNLRVVIPSTPTSSSNLTSNDLNYSEHARLVTTLNTPVIALQTPIVPSLNSYPVSSFGAQDFSMTSSDLNMITSWNSSHQNLSASLHNSGIPHLAVSNSTPPPSSSPIPVKIKAEPISPPRDQMLSHQQQSLSASSIIGGNHGGSLGSTLNHSHLMNSRPSSTGHLTPTTLGSSTTPHSPISHNHNQSIGGLSSHLPDYENASHAKRPRISEGWAT